MRKIYIQSIKEKHKIEFYKYILKTLPYMDTTQDLNIRQLEDRIKMTNNAFSILPEHKTQERVDALNKLIKQLSIKQRNLKIEKIKSKL